MVTTRASKAKIKLVPYSKKQKMLTTWWVPGISPYADKDVIICDGAIRSGKTTVGSMSFILWAMYTFNYTNFGIAGKSLDSLKRNLWVPLQQWFGDIGMQVVRLRETTNGYILKYSYVDKKGNTRQVENYFFLFGGKDEGSYQYVQGFTAGGFFFDECALMPQSFVNQAVARCSTEGSKIWFNCNPQGPFHWFKTDWIDKVNEKNGYHLHFKMQDNPSLSPKTLKRYNETWTGVFYQRFILGEWVAAEGTIYLTFANNVERYLINDVKSWITKNNKRLMAIYIGVDWGHNKSANVAVAVGITENYKDIIVLDEWYTKELLDPEELYKYHVKFAKNVVDNYGPCTIYCDNAEMMLVRGLKNSIQKAQLRANVKPCIKYEIVDRIVLSNSLFAQGRIWIAGHCKWLVDGFRTSVWDMDKKRDIRLDDGTTNIDSLDAFEYALCGHMRQIGNYVELGNKAGEE